MNLSTKLKECQTKNYLLNNGCICWDEKTEFYNNCRFYIKNTINAENSPWAKDSDVIPHYRNQKLSVLQKRIIQYLHKNFFRWGSPSYLRMEKLADRLGSTKRAVRKSIERLTKREILLRTHIFSDKYKQYRSIILPINPSEVILPNNNNTFDYKRSSLDPKRSPLSKDREDRLISKLPRSLQKNRHLIDYIYSINTINSSLLIKESLKTNKTTFYTARQSRTADNISFTSKKKEQPNMKIPRYKLNVTCSEPTLDKKRVDLNQLMTTVDFDIFSLDDNQRRNLLTYVESHTYDFEFNKVFSNKKLNVRHPVAKKQIKQLLSDYLKLFFSNEPLNHESTDYVLRYWNNIDNPKFQKHKTDNHDSLIYTTLLILTNYMLRFYYDNDMTKFLQVVERFEMYGSQNHYLANNLKKWSLDKLIMLRNSNNIKKYFIVNDKDFESELFKYRSKHKDAAQRWKDIYISSFFRTDKKKGVERYNKWNNKLDSFLDLLINRMRATPRILYKRNLTRQMTIDGYETESILADYCDWISFTIAKRPSIFDLTNYDHFMQFVHQEMRGVRGMENFWRSSK